MSAVPHDGEAVDRATQRVLTALREVAARRQPNVAMSADPVALEMVSAALAAQFDGAPEGWSDAAAAIVRTIEEDPAAWPRVERLWTLLQNEQQRRKEQGS
jgi:hypothetical protein